MRITPVVFVIWFATLHIYRIEFAPEGFPFLITPNLIVSAVVLAVVFFNFLTTRGKQIAVTPSRQFYVFALVTLSVLLFLSSMLSADPSLSLKRTVLFLVITVTSVVVTSAVLDRSDFRSLMARAIPWPILVSGAFTVVQLDYIFGVVFDRSFYQGLPHFMNLVPDNYEGLGFRMNGGGNDPNIQSLYYIVLFHLCNIFMEPTRRRKTYQASLVIMLLLGFSRSGLLALLIYLVVYYRKKLIKPLLATGLGVAILMSLLPSVFDIGISDFNLQRIVEQKANPEEGSVQIHIALLERGFKVIASSLKVELWGNGYGASYTVLSDIFDEKYAHFHSSFLDMLVSGGIMVFITFCALVFGTLRNKAMMPANVSSLVLNTLYNTVAFPPFWFLISFSYLSEDGDHGL